MDLVPGCFCPQPEPEELSKRSQLSGCSGCTPRCRPLAELSLDVAKKEEAEKERKSQHYTKIGGEF